MKTFVIGGIDIIIKSIDMVGPIDTCKGKHAFNIMVNGSIQRIMLPSKEEVINARKLLILEIEKVNILSYYTKKVLKFMGVCKND